MPTSRAEATWIGTLREGRGEVEFGDFKKEYSYASRWEGGGGTNPEELLGAAHAACFSMSLAARLARLRVAPERLTTHAEVLLLPGPEFRIARIVLTLRAVVPGLDIDAFRQVANEAKENCPVSKALAGVAEIELRTELVEGSH